jgi:hypothetical protein
LNIDFSNLTVAQFAFYLLIVTALDVGGSTVLAVIHGKFSLAYVAVWIQSHVLRRVFPIIGLAILGHGVSQIGVDQIPAVWTAALVALAAYFLETVKSLMESFQDTADAPSEPSPIPAPK